MKYNPDVFSRLPELLAKLSSLKPPSPREENLFQIGGRGHYENPTSQLLEFFLDASRGHGFGSVILDVLLEAAKISPGTIDTQMSYWTSHEVVTDEALRNDRMDLILESESWVIVIENKIRHDVINDFDAYARFAQSKRKKSVLILLSARKVGLPPGWNDLNWKDLIQAIRSKLELGSIDLGQGKWPLFLREFLDNVEAECSRNGSMDQALFDFSVEHFSGLYQAQDVFQNFLSEIQIRWTNSFRDMENVVVRDSRIERMWQGKVGGGWQCIPIRFLLERPAMEIVLKVFPSGRFGINLYPRSVQGVDLEQLRLVYKDSRKIEAEKGYLACIVADSDDLQFAEAISFARSAIIDFQKLCSESHKSRCLEN